MTRLTDVTIVDVMDLSGAKMLDGVLEELLVEELFPSVGEGAEGDDDKLVGTARENFRSFKDF